MAVDGTMRPLKIPPKFVPYLEKHHIYDIFYDMVINLIRYRPDDVISFMKAEFKEMQKFRNTQYRVNFIAPSHIDIDRLAGDLADETDTLLIRLEDIVTEFKIQKNNEEPFYDPGTLAKSTKQYIEKRGHLTGWVFAGFPRTKEEARELQRIGILPTHTIEFLHSPKDYAVNDLWNENIGSWSYEDYRRMLIDYKKRSKDLCEVYKSTLKKVVIRGRNRMTILNECCELVRKLPHIGAPMLPRVVLIGTRGSRRKTLATMLSKRFKLVHVNYQQVLRRGGTLENKLGDEIRHLEQNATLNVEMCLKLLEDRLLEKDCMTYGWVLTGYPNDETDFKSLDSLQMPPNRIAILDICNEACLDRLTDRRINMFNGEILSHQKTLDNYWLQKELAIHPDDHPAVVCAEQERYSSEIQSILEYCEHKAAIIDATGSLQEVFEKLENAVINRQPIQTPDILQESQSLYNQFHPSFTVKNSSDLLKDSSSFQTDSQISNYSYED